ncbi:MAG TPA: HEPN domain-containing protein [bacterium]|nr:HEPN domain-containing protein [bacterium]HEX68164.1 HEPN domain-containing protein [bacterium]
MPYRFLHRNRYPVPWPSGVSREEAEKARKYAESIRDFVRNLLNIKP